MIIKGGSRSNRRFFARHLLNAKDNEEVRLVELKGFAHEDVDGALRDMEAVAKGTRCKNFFYHADMNPREGEHLTPEQWGQAVDTLERHLGYEGQPRVVIEHEKEGRVHRHVIWQRIDLDTMTARADSLTYPKHEAAAREIERDCGLEPVASVLVKDREGPRPQRRAKDWEGFRGKQTGLNPEEVRAQVTALWEQSDSGAAFKAALEANGYILCKGDRRDFCIVDPAGDEHSLARRISGVKAAEVRERMKDVERDSLPTVAVAREKADAWGNADSEAAWAVQEAEMDRQALGLRRSIERGGVTLQGEPEVSADADWWKRQEWFMSRMGREGWEYQERWSALEKTAKEYGGAVKDVARAGQDAYWQAVIGGKPKTEADKLHDIMWGEKEKEPELER
jgi:hypothetical protein